MYYKRKPKTARVVHKIAWLMEEREYGELQARYKTGLRAALTKPYIKDYQRFKGFASGGITAEDISVREQSISSLISTNFLETRYLRETLCSK